MDKKSLGTSVWLGIFMFFPLFLSTNVNAQVEDTTPPVLTAFSFSPDTINTAMGVATIIVNFSATDDLSGVNSFQANFTSPSRQQFATTSGVSVIPPAGSASRTANVTFPQFSETGTWEPEVMLWDAAGNLRILSAVDLAVMGFPIALEVGSTQSVSIDIKPGSDPNCFNQNERGVIPVAILGAADLDVKQIKVDSLSLQGLSVKMVGKTSRYLAHYDYVNGDAYLDLVVQFADSDDWTASGTDNAILTGTLLDGTPIEGQDSICIVPQKKR